MNWQQIKTKVVFTQPIDPQTWMDSYLAENPLSDWAAGAVATQEEIEERDEYLERCKPGTTLSYYFEGSDPGCFWCGPDDANGEGGCDGADVYDELEELFADINNGNKYIHLGAAVEIGSATNFHESDLGMFQKIPGFLTDPAVSEEDQWKEIEDFLIFRLKQLGAVKA